MENQVTFSDLSTRLYELIESEAYSTSTAKDMRFILEAFSAYMSEIRLEEYTPEIGKQLIKYCEHHLHVCSSRVSRAKNIVRKLNRLLQGLDGRDALWTNKSTIVNLPNALLKSLDVYTAYCEENGNRQTTLRYKRWICGRFLENLSALGCKKTDEITGELVQSAFLTLGYTRYWERIGPFLRFLFEKGLSEHNYSKLILHRNKRTPQPTVYSPEEIAVVENNVNRDTPAGIRNYAIILLLSRYGIRACDIAALSFENIDFINNRLHFIQQKTGDPWEGELLPQVRSALQEYIENVRPDIDSCSKVFMTLMIPYKPVDSAAINTMVGTVFQNAEVNIAGRRHGSRAFRSSIASNMINDSVSTEVVRRVLGHGTRYALKYYARIDIESMRLCPIVVQEPSGTFAELLSWKVGESHV